MSEREANFVPFVPLGSPAGNPSYETFEVDGIKIKACYDAGHKLLFVLDMTKDKLLPNVLLVLAKKGDRKWDDILENDFGISPESVRPRVSNKYQKLDIDYESLDYYNDAIVNGAAEALRSARMDIAARQKELRIADAEQDIALADATITEAKKTIGELDDFIRLQKEKLRVAKKNVGKEPPKDSAAKILRFEARIDKAEAKKGRAMRRMKRAANRIDSAENLLNNYSRISVAKRREDDVMNDNEVQPLLTENPNIVDTTNAFKPVAFAPEPQKAAEPEDDINIDLPPPSAPPIQTMAAPAPRPAYAAAAPASYARPNGGVAAAPVVRPIAPISGTDIKITAGSTSRPGGAYYFMLILLIGLSIFTLYLYQKKMNSDALPHIAATTNDVQDPSNQASESDGPFIGAEDPGLAAESESAPQGVFVVPEPEPEPEPELTAPEEAEQDVQEYNDAGLPPEAEAGEFDSVPEEAAEEVIDEPIIDDGGAPLAEESVIDEGEEAFDDGMEE